MKELCTNLGHLWVRASYFTYHAIRLRYGDKNRRLRTTHSIHVKCFEIVRIGVGTVRRCSGTGGIKRARNLQEVITEVESRHTFGDLERTISAMRFRRGTSDLIRLRLRAVIAHLSNKSQKEKVSRVCTKLTFFRNGMRSSDPHPGFSCTVFQAS